MGNIIDKAYDKAIETAEPFVETIKVRLTNPFFASFAISAIVINWRPILYFIFSKSSIEDKIEHISVQYYNPYYWDVIMYILIPLLVSCLYIFGIPRLNVFINEKNKKPIDAINNAEYTLISDKYDKQVEYAKKENAIAVARASTNKIEELNTKIGKLEFELNENIGATTRLDSFNKELSNKNEDLETCLTL